MADFTTVLEFADKAIAVLKDESEKEYFSKLSESIKNAANLEVDEKDNDRKNIQLTFNAVSLANQVVYSAFLSSDLTDNLEAEFRTLPSLKAVSEDLKAAVAVAKKEEEDLTAVLNSFRERGRKFDLIHAVCAGRSLEEAQQMQAEYDKQVAQGMRG